MEGQQGSYHFKWSGQEMWHLSKKNPEADHRCKGPEVRMFQPGGQRGLEEGGDGAAEVGLGWGGEGKDGSTRSQRSDHGGPRAHGKEFKSRSS